MSFKTIASFLMRTTPLFLTVLFLSSKGQAILNPTWAQVRAQASKAAGSLATQREIDMKGSGVNVLNTGGGAFVVGPYTYWQNPQKHFCLSKMGRSPKFQLKTFLPGAVYDGICGQGSKHVFQVGSGVYYMNPQFHYCWVSKWSTVTSWGFASGAQIPRLPSLQGSYDGVCRNAQGNPI